jgi:hypothetical protein
VLADVGEGWISQGRAFDVYGVRIGDDGEVDEEATAARRVELARSARD